MRIPIEYGDNFPVPPGSWDPSVPWRFPRERIQLREPSLLSQGLPWIMLVVGGILGMFCMSWALGVLEEGKGGLSGSPERHAEQVVVPGGVKVPAKESLGIEASPGKRAPKAQSRMA